MRLRDAQQIKVAGFIWDVLMVVGNREKALGILEWLTEQVQKHFPAVGPVISVPADETDPIPSVTQPPRVDPVVYIDEPHKSRC